jgi:class 3 adenylate cyclase
LSQTRLFKKIVKTRKNKIINKKITTVMTDNKTNGLRNFSTGAAGSGMAKFRRAMKNVKELNHQQSLFLPKARRLSEMHQMLHREIESKATVEEPTDTKDALAQAAKERNIAAAKALAIKKLDIKFRIQEILKGKYWQTVISIVTIFALYGDDLRLLSFPKSADVVFEVLSFLALLLFFGEMGLQVYVIPDYLYSFNFWLDVVSTLSLIPDIAFLWNLFSPAEEEGGSSAVLSASRASRAGTRAIRIVRIVRLVRMVRIVKLLNNLRKKNKDAAQIEKEKMDGHSKVGERLLKETSRKIIELVLVLVLFLPFFDGGLESQYNQFQNFGLAELHRVPQDYNLTGSITELSFRKQFQEYVRNSGKLFYIRICNERCATVWSKEQTTDVWLKELRFQPFIPGTTEVDRTAEFTETVDPVTKWSYESLEKSEEDILSKYRTAERPSVISAGCYMDCTAQKDDPWSIETKGHACTSNPEKYENDASAGYGVTSFRYAGCLSIAYFDNRGETQNTAGMNMLKTTFVMIILAGGILGVDRDAQKLVITPIRRMVNMINKLANDPLSKGDSSKSGENEDEGNSYETHIIEETLGKVGQLMQVGFGAAGAEIIRQNLQSGSFDPMIKGKRITAIYMFCDIRRFTDTTECLQEDVMVYVNSLGDLCHTTTVAYYGMANKNVGDAFLLTWKLCDGDLAGFSHFDNEVSVSSRDRKCPPHAGGGDVDREITAAEMADSALTATIKICNDLALANIDGNLVQFIKRPNIVERFGADFTIRMGYGVHVGWCIEGAIGSLQKIDCTYLSPHVELSDRLEAGSKIFLQPINLSHWFVQLLSPAARKFLRMVCRRCLQMFLVILV